MGESQIPRFSFVSTLMTVMDDHKNKYSWRKLLVRKWMNMKGKEDENQGGEKFEDHYESFFGRRRSCSDNESSCSRKSLNDNFSPVAMEPEVSQVTETRDFRIFVATWNVGGKAPHKGLNLEEWLRGSAPADIYILG